MPKTFALTVDLKEDDDLIAAYEAHHRAVPEPVSKSILDAGILSMEIYRWKNRLFMVMVTTDDFSFESKKKMDQVNPDVQAWEEQMWKFQQALPGTKPGEKWQLMSCIFEL